VSDLLKLTADFQNALTRQIIPFWLKNSRDERCGGYFDYLSASGGVIEGDKSIATQAQQAAVFASLYKNADNQTDYLKHAQHGGAFLRQFAQDTSLKCYAEVDRRGRAVAPSVDCVADCYVTMAYADLYFATDEVEWATLSIQTFDALCQYRSDRREQQQQIGGFRQVRHLGEAVAFLQTILTMRPLLDDERARDLVETARHELLHEFLDRRTDTLREFVLPGGAFLNTPEGRRQNVGLTFRAMSALLDVCAKPDLTKSGTGRAANRKLTAQVTNWALQVCERAWDESAGGLVRYIDLKDQPFVFPDATQKWAWVQLEAILALAKIYRKTQQPACLTWLERIHRYVFQYFPDLKHAAWHVALDKTNQPLISAKAIPASEPFACLRAIAETADGLSSVIATDANAKPVRVTTGIAR